jgi:hypothetical protein
VRGCGWAAEDFVRNCGWRGKCAGHGPSPDVSMIDPSCSLHENPHLTMTSQRAPPRSNAEKLSDCIKYITGGGGFHSFGQFLSTLLDDVVETDGGPKARREFHVSDHTR